MKDSDLEEKIELILWQVRGWSYLPEENGKRIKKAMKEIRKLLELIKSQLPPTKVVGIHA